MIVLYTIVYILSILEKKHQFSTTVSILRSKNGELKHDS